MSGIKLTQAQARRFLLAHQGLWPPHSLRGKKGVLSFVRHVGCIQYDPLNIVGTNPELVLQARVEDFTPALLDELLYQDRTLIDGWDKNVSIYPVEDWPSFARRRAALLRHYGAPSRPAMAVLPQVRAALQERGPLSSIDLEMNQQVAWSWAPTRIARAALESMYAWGEVVIHHRVNTRKVYDLAQRHLPPDLLDAPDPFEADEAYHEWHVKRRIGCVGLLSMRGGDAWLGNRGIQAADRRAAAARLLARGEIVQTRIEGLRGPFYLRSQDRTTLERVLADEPDGEGESRAAILAPLDNLMWDRCYLHELFGFEYRWEVYKPVAERRWGYYVLPVLYGDRFVARFEPGRENRDHGLTIANWWWEPGVTQTEVLSAALGTCLTQFLRFLDRDRLYLDPELVERAELHFAAALDAASA
jgi:uncharacterized protein YcaQ